MPSTRRPAPRAAASTGSIMSRRAAAISTRWRGPFSVSVTARRLPVQDGLVERHRQRVLRLEAHGGVELLALGADGQLDGADDDLLVGDADAHAAVQALVLRTTPAAGPR